MITGWFALRISLSALLICAAAQGPGMVLVSWNDSYTALCARLSDSELAGLLQVPARAQRTHATKLQPTTAHSTKVTLLLVES